MIEQWTRFLIKSNRVCWVSISTQFWMICWLTRHHLWIWNFITFRFYNVVMYYFIIFVWCRNERKKDTREQGVVIRWILFLPSVLRFWIISLKCNRPMSVKRSPLYLLIDQIDLSHFLDNVDIWKGNGIEYLSSSWQLDSCMFLFFSDILKQIVLLRVLFIQ